LGPALDKLSLVNVEGNESKLLVIPVGSEDCDGESSAITAKCIETIKNFNFFVTLHVHRLIYDLRTKNTLRVIVR